MNDQGQALWYANGIDGETGEYSLQPLNEQQLLEAIRGEGRPTNLQDLKIRHRQTQTGLLGTKRGVKAERIEEAGWGVIFGRDADPAVKEALTELIELRKGQAGAFFRCYEGDGGLMPGESKSDFLERHGAGPGPADPDKVPYYLLLVGSPEEIPYRFQTQLDVQYAVGRIHFETLQEYANYARSVVEAESGGVQLPRRATFLGVVNDDDPATELSESEMIARLHGKLRDEWSDWEFNSFLKTDASRANLANLLNGQDAPAFLFTAGHGLALRPGHRRQLDHQGALIGAEWPGPKKWAGRGEIPEEFYFAGDHLSSEDNLLGMIAFFYACFGAGTPLYDEFRQRLPGTSSARLAPSPFVSRLPSRMLSLPRGGALAVVGHVERTWPFSFRWGTAGTQLVVYEDMLAQLRAGHPIGYAVESFNERYAELATVLSDALEPRQGNGQADPGRLALMWMANNDARGYAIVGDPAVRLPLVKPDGEERARPAIRPIEIAGRPKAGTRWEEGDPAPAANGRSDAGAPDSLSPFSPLPPIPAEYKELHPELYEAWVAHIKTGYENNDQVFQRILNAFMRSHNITLAMYVLLFLAGISFFVAALILALFMNATIAGVAFGGLSVVSFIAYFLSRPTQAVEENLLYITWLGIIYNSYWTRLAWSFDPDTAQEALQEATDGAITQLNAVIDKHAASTGKRPG